MSVPRFMTIRQTAKEGPLSEYCLRAMQKRGELPGVFSGNRFLVNYDRLLDRLNGLEVIDCDIRNPTDRG